MLTMEDSWHSLVSRREMDDFFNQGHMIHCNEKGSLKDTIVQQLGFSTESNPSSSSLQSNLNSKPLSFPSGYVLCFDNPNFEAHNQNHSSKRAQHHVLAERKRREELTKTILQLSAIIPGLEKTDKASVVRGAVKYVKRLQDRVKELENQKRKECVKPILSINDHVEQKLPQMKISVLNKEVLIGIFCHRPNSTLVKVLSLLNDLHLSMTRSSVLPFGTSTFKVTIIAKMNEEGNMTIDDLIKALRGRLLSLKSQNLLT